MMIAKLNDDDLLSATRTLVRRASNFDADLVVHLGEIDARQLFLGRAFPSMFAFCLDELGFSEDVAYNRIAIARLSRRLPSTLDALRSGRVHLAGLRILAPHLTEENVADVLAKATGKSKRTIEELAAALAPKPPVAPSIRKIPERCPVAATALLSITPRSETSAAPATPVMLPIAPAPPAPPKPVVRPIAEDLFKIQFSARRTFREKLKAAQDLLQHAVPNGDPAEVIERALDLLIAEAKKDRFGVGRKPRSSTEAPSTTPVTRHIPDAIKRAVYERDEGRCTYQSPDGRRCAETGGLELDHKNGFARDPTHSVESLQLRCRPHNQHGANQMYGRVFMEDARRKAKARQQEASTRPGADVESEDRAKETPQRLLL